MSSSGVVFSFICSRSGRFDRKKGERCDLYAVSARDPRVAELKASGG